MLQLVNLIVNLGTKNQGIDIKFLQVVNMLSSNEIYSLQKATTRNFLKKKSVQLGLEMEAVNWTLEKDIFVDFIRLSKSKP